MTLQANSAGTVAGKFTIPAGIPSGTKKITFVGSAGSYGEASFIGQGSGVIETQQVITTASNSFSAGQHTNPLAQTLTIDNAQQIKGIDLWFTAKSLSVVELQVRETSAGLPTQTILTSVRLEPSLVNTNGTPTRFNFHSPCLLASGAEYAIVVLCNDAITALSIAELGKLDTTTGQWVTTQPYQVGVLLASSDGSTWTASQDKDLAFRLIRANYSSTAATVALGSVDVVGATDLLVRATIENPSSNTGCDFLLTFPDASTQLVSADQPVRLNTAITGAIAIAAVLNGNITESPVLHRDVQLIHGAVAASCNYVSRAISGGTDVIATVIVDVLLPGDSSLTVQAKGIDAIDGWTTLNSVSSAQLGDSWVEITYTSAVMTETMIHAQLILTGSSQYRPRIKNLRMLVA